MRTSTRSNLLRLCLTLNVAQIAYADFEPIVLAPGSYNHDVVIERAAPPPAVQVTTASMEAGVGNSGFTWFERGYLSEWPATGLPEAGTLLASDLLADHHFRMPASYRIPNAFLIDTARSNALVTLTIPTNYTALSFLTSSGVGRNVIRYNLIHDDGSNERGTFTSPNWYNDGDPAWAANGKVNVTSFVRADLNSYNPRLYSADIAVANTVSPINSVTLSLAEGSGHTAVFAISGAPFEGSDFNPISIAGYSEDLVVEASAVKPGFLETNTTATMDSGTANARFTWYEKGYNAAAAETGLPAPNSLLTSAADGSHRFLMPASYSQPNAILIDSVCSNAVVNPLKSAPYSTLSLLTASSYGPTTNQYIVNHANGKSETNTFVSPDWLSSLPGAVVAHGRVNVSNKMIDQLNADAPRLVAVDLPLLETNSSVTHLRFSRLGLGTNNHTVIFAVSGAPTSLEARPALSITRGSAGQITIRSTKPGRLESCVSLFGAETNWRDEGEISLEMSPTPVAGQTVQFFRLKAN